MSTTRGPGDKCSTVSGTARSKADVASPVPLRMPLYRAMTRSSTVTRVSKVGGGWAFSYSLAGLATTSAVCMGIHNRPS